MASSATSKKLQPIIVKRVKKAAHAHHGGAWKIAYADFVTAMMAFFLLMWLLGSTAKGDLQGIANYFHAPMKVSMEGGDGAGSSSSVIKGGGKDLTRANGETRKSDGAKSDPTKSGGANDPESKREQQAKQDARRMDALREKIENAIGANPRLKDFRSQIRLAVTIDGLEIQIVDEQLRPMFDSGSALVKPYMREILHEIGTTLNGIENRVSLAGHTDAAPYGNGVRGYGNWELSADRANASRRELVNAGMPDDKLLRVVGLAASDLLEKDTPLAPVNRRISVTVLTREAEARLLGGARMEANDAVKAIVDQVARQPAPAAPPAPVSPAAARIAQAAQTRTADTAHAAPAPAR